MSRTVSMQFGNPGGGAGNKSSRWALLWENGSPSDSFGAQTISLNLSNYVEVMIGCRPFEGDALVLTQGIVGYMTRLIITSSTNNRNGMRDATVSASGIEFTACQYNNATNNSYCVPLYIWAR